jgi:hypothetical protein
MAYIVIPGNRVRDKEVAISGTYFLMDNNVIKIRNLTL